MDLKSKSFKLSLAAITALGTVSSFTHDLHAAIVIDEVYGGGGSTSTSASYTQDFVELYNSGTAAFDLTGLTVRYASSNSLTFVAANTFVVQTLPSVSLAPGAHFLISGATGSAYKGGTLPTADATSPFSLSATAGAVGLFANATDTDLTLALDVLGYGAAKLYEGTSTAALSTTTSAYRTVDGVDTNKNNVDFTVGTPNPQNTTSGVPEPTALGLAAVGSSLILRRRSR